MLRVRRFKEVSKLKYKSLLGLFILGVLVVVLAACGRTTESTTTTPPTTTTEPPDTSTTGTVEPPLMTSAGHAEYGEMLICLVCHGVGTGEDEFPIEGPDDHTGRTESMCLGCHLP